MFLASVQQNLAKKNITVYKIRDQFGVNLTITVCASLMTGPISKLNGSLVICCFIVGEMD